ncbi:cobalt ABC transporter substrate-binding protein CbiN [Rhodoplanes elegans]|uniref:Cobalt transport protein CbiN n=1 Tax=Rhodoplanes elegans TaxID=29408 RepID=A0A327KJP4_9BRAD|nr:energy-coupling factor ABC transporter substrate-binding protein [Rhodoplanes elegans]MBK5959976.1 cobalt ABC transporter substrate-binding protein CbiN [Rhodoplanes elegans]RAI38717.1 cobalt ABC transporter substrate-binding protein CbiN [Rhodoplanes elegans]
MISKRSSWLLVALAAAIVAAPLLLPGIEGEFKGTDDQAVSAIVEARPGYEPWFKPLWTPPNGEIQSLLFALQAALGAGVLGYVIGRRHGRSSASDDVTRR